MITVDAKGQACPMPVIMTKKAIGAMNGETQVEVLVDNAIAVQNVTKMAQSLGGEVTTETSSDAEFKIKIQMGECAETDEAVEEESVVMVKSNKVIAIDSDRMGSGNDDLGKVLIKGFIFAVTQLEELPKTMLFYNGGATLTAEGSDSLEDLQWLADHGVEILTCGTCLNYYDMSDKLVIGSVTNMYTIVEKMTEASLIVKP